MERNQFTFYKSYWDAIRLLPKKERAPVLEAVIAYALDETEPEGLSGVATSIFTLIRPTLDSGRRRAAAGKQGGSKTKANDKQSESEKEKEGEREEE